MYKTFVRPLLFSRLKADPEWLHNHSMNLLQWLEKNQDRFPANLILQQVASQWCYSEKRLSQTLWGITFPNPLGLAAGFDKNGVAASIWDRLGFGYTELGTVTEHPQPGNPRPRLFRLLEDEAALNRMGFNNEGSQALAECLQKQAQRERKAPWGINLGKSKITPLEEAASDYRTSFLRLRDWGDYFVVNVSSPNTPGLRSLQDSAQLSLILEAIQSNNPDQKPILVKIAPDLTWDAIREVLTIATQYQLAGMIATNTTIAREGLKTKVLAKTGKPVTEEAGGLSGKPLRDRATEIIRFIYDETEGKLPIIGVGGIFTAEDAWEKITAGATLLQVYTGWIYEGPLMPRRVMAGLTQKLDEHGLLSLSDAVGLSHRDSSVITY
ncbi:dihydroorotate oxidase A [Halothece sp. PCC 7418]|uniref:quinone-dependent dihydroorotate dehydrogenase n=1 Tax=Halothece sp. (strain PCC 7418) TaxID=65093 RepID=UPI0002A075C3|nr:quinone-dependent dihydroorotate dehydrogenase [Halothece sp. PCC 7418]AFZ45065.1 dihydroorotate oxidase A [Halothece sp. PCC 7418]